MSRVSKKIIDIPSDATVTFNRQTAIIKGPKGELAETFDERMTFRQSKNTLEVVRPTNSRKDKTVRDTTRTLLNNMVQGVSQNSAKTPGLIGVGYHAQVQSSDLVSNVGYSHPVEIKAEDGITFAVKKDITVTIPDVSKEQVGATVSSTRSVRPPEPYKGKDIRYQGECVRRKKGKTGE